MGWKLPEEKDSGTMQYKSLSSVLEFRNFKITYNKYLSGKILVQLVLIFKKISLTNFLCHICYFPWFLVHCFLRFVLCNFLGWLIQRLSKENYILLSQQWFSIKQETAICLVIYLAGQWLESLSPDLYRKLQY